MKLRRLLIKNFGSYYGKNEIDLSTTDDKPVVIIIGRVGWGKTTIFHAINWALYGDDYEKVLMEREQKSITDLIHTKAINESNTGDIFKVSCQLYFEHEGKNYYILRELQVTKTSDNSKKVSLMRVRPSLSKISSSGNHEIVEFNEVFLNEILPNNVREYFLFDGDRIEQLAKPGASSEIRDGIYRVIDLELLQNGAEHLGKVAERFRKKALKAATGDVAEIEKEWDHICNIIEHFKSEISNKDLELVSLSDQIEIIDDKLRNLEGAREHQKERDELKEKLKYLEENQANLLVEIREVTTKTSLNLALSSMQRLSDNLNKKRQKGEIPSAISENLIKDLLDLKECICGTQFSDGDQLYKTLSDRLNSEREKQASGQQLLDLYYGTQSAIQDIRHTTDILIQKDKERAELENIILSSDKLLNQINQKLGDLPDVDISKLVENLRERIDAKNDLESNLISIKKQLQETLESKSEIENERAKIGKQQSNVRKNQYRENLAQKAEEELTKIFERFAEDTRKEVELLTNQKFHEITPTVKQLKVRITPEFHYDVRDDQGNDALPQLSNGQKQSLSLGFITSISQISEKDPPLVIDMPMSRLDDETQENIAARLPELASQVILMLLPGPEWNKKTEDLLRPKAASIYNLDFDEEDRITTIQKEKV